MTRLASAVAALVVVGLTGAAHADKADQLFKKGKRLLADKRYAEACTAFQDSDRLDPTIGAKLNVARCYEEWGKLATAWRWYTDAERTARDAHDDRARKIRGLISELEPQIPRITIKLPPGANAAELAIKLDGLRIDASAIGSEQRVDPGPHQITYLVDGTPQDKLVPIERAGTLEILLDTAAAKQPAVDPESEPGRTAGKRKKRRAHDGNADDTDGDEDGSDRGARTPLGRNQRILGLTITGAGAVALGVAGLVTLSARSDYHHALDAHCLGDKDKCDPVGQAAADGARHRANIATIVSIAGVAAVAGGLLTYFIAPRGTSRREHAFYLAPDVGADHGSFVLGGAF